MNAKQTLHQVNRICMRQKLIGLLGGRVEGNRVIDLIVHAEGNLLIAAVNTARAGIDKMLLAGISFIGMPTRLQDIVEANDIRLHVHIRVVNAVTNPGLRRQIHLRHDLPNARFILLNSL